MKSIKYIVLALSFVAVLSCNKFLDKKPLDKFTDDNFWTSENNVQTFANTFYGQFSGYGNGGGSGVFYFPTLNDNQASNGFTQWSYTNVPASISLWSSGYTELRRANLMIDRIPGIASMSDAAKNNWIGVARLYRALMHYQLVRAFGDIIYVDKVLDVTDEDKELYLYGDRQDRDLVMDKVLEDLNFAVANITMNPTSRVLFNANVANAIKSEICLYEGTFCKYRSAADGQKPADASRANKFLTEAKNASQAIMSNSMYSLNSSYIGNYNSDDLKDNKEMILYKHYVTGALVHSTIDYTCSSTMQSGMSKDAFDSYLFTDGNPLATTTLDKSDHPKYDAGDEILKLDDMLAVRDARLSAAIDPVLMYRGNGYVRFGVGMETTSSTGYGVYKFDNSKFPVIYRNQTSSNYSDAPIYWLSNILLNYAEACAELGSITQADLDKSINLLRKRAKLPNLTTSPAADPANNMGVSNIIWEVRRERRVELMYDNNDRYWSLIRWHQLDKLDTKNHPNQVLGAYVMDDPIMSDPAANKPTVNSAGYIDASQGLNRLYEAKHYLYPIPSGQIDLYEAVGKTLTQNYGW